jgi:hypothetical protein
MTEKQGETIIRLLTAILLCASIIVGRVVFG